MSDEGLSRSMEDRVRLLQGGEDGEAAARQTTVDPVTGLRNRLGILQSTEGALQWNAREGTPFGLMAVAVPALAEIGRTAPAGVVREALVHVAAVLSAGLRAVDRIGRWSDDLFLVVLAKLGDDESAGRVSGRLAAMLAVVPFVAGESRYPLASRTACGLVASGAVPAAEEVVSRVVDADGSEDPDRPEILRFLPMSSDVS